jgi:hypothetical protein
MEANFSRGEQYTEREIRIGSNTQHDKRITIGTLITSFKVKKDQIVNRRSYCCYDFGNYLNVPDAWHNTRNRIFDFGNVEVWNVRTFASAFRGKGTYGDV